MTTPTFARLAPTQAPCDCTVPVDLAAAFQDCAVAEEKLAAKLSEIGPPAYNLVRECESLAAAARNECSRIRATGDLRT